MRGADRELACRNCGRVHAEGRLDRRRWCPACRGVVIVRATRVARLVAVLGALLVVGWIAVFIGSVPRFLIGWAVLVVAVYYFVFKLTQRVAFEIIRGRGVPAPPED